MPTVLLKEFFIDKIIWVNWLFCIRTWLTYIQISFLTKYMIGLIKTLSTFLILVRLWSSRIAGDQYSDSNIIFRLHFLVARSPGLSMPETNMGTIWCLSMMLLISATLTADQDDRELGLDSGSISATDDSDTSNTSLTLGSRSFKTAPTA